MQPEFPRWFAGDAAVENNALCEGTSYEITALAL